MLWYIQRNLGINEAYINDLHDKIKQISTLYFTVWPKGCKISNTQQQTWNLKMVAILKFNMAAILDFKIASKSILVQVL